MLQVTSRYRQAALGLTAIGAGVGLLIGVVSGPVGAEGVTHVDGNPKCSDLGYANGFKIDVPNPSEGTYATDSDGVDTEGDASGFVVEIGYSDFPVLHFTTNTAVDAVLVKAGPGANLYQYDPPVTNGSGLDSPKDSISHITFCWDDGDGDNGSTTTTKPGEEPPGEEPGDESPDGEGPKPGEPAPPVAGEPTFTG